MRLTRTHLTFVLALLLVFGGAAAGFFIGTSSQPAKAADATAAAGQVDAQDFDAAMAAAGFALDPSAAGTVAANANAGGPAARVTAILGLRTRLARLARTLVHAQATLDLPKRGVQTYALDQGKVGTVSATSLTITETGGATVSFTLTTATRVRAKGATATLASVTNGEDVIVVSEQSNGAWLGLAIVVVPAAAAPANSPAPSS